ncbi:MAG TPA: hypothetical protein VK025_08290 [Steroidobacter sp.]|jgi:hypothetical protein|nr:hypothetical protein [Steroidobacteraceae bacterium]HLS81387.1 hypothetical protein [Steroidobacter sp.]
MRFTAVLSLCAVALWGLFSLLENLRKPELLRSSQAVVVKGCEIIESDEARRLCPQLNCQKALLEARTFPVSARFEVTVDERALQRRIVAGLVKDRASPTQGGFACVIERGKVVLARSVDEAQLARLSQDAGGAVRDWTDDWSSTTESP